MELGKSSCCRLERFAAAIRRTLCYAEITEDEAATGPVIVRQPRLGYWYPLWTSIRVDTPLNADEELTKFDRKEKGRLWSKAKEILEAGELLGAD